MDVVSAFAVALFGLAWFFFHRTPDHERIVRLFLGTLMAMAAMVGALGLLLRSVS
ncbi:MAG: hypothetical protein KIT00_06360 [Rhodospirillales bacterium]|nr:hypothetical protein [Rhodospirillales bacterium]